ncbi:MAG: AAA family ATPase [Sediminibacterium sp.]|nr:AAA family ATPase [Sediminibacterium sp.]MDP3127673.1 AAA family ATPase [Sediminibacterium sp.]
MRENGIEYIKIQNFKAFQEEKTFNIGRKHVLVYGSNGSGKSSLYWALYTLFQCSVKPLTKINKYFTQTDDENLLNINQPTLPSHISIKTITGEAEDEFTLSNIGITGDNAKLKELNQASEFISHRLLINFYNFRNSKEINLFDVFDRDILPFVFGEIYFKGKMLSQALESIELKLNPLTGRNWKSKKNIEDGDLANFNREIAWLINYINDNATKFLEENFTPNEIKIKLVLKGVYRISDYKNSGKTKYYITPPVYKLAVENKKSDGIWHPIERPQSFLNEARLTKIGIAIRFCLLPKRPTIPLQILALDDLLISLDLDNRVKLIEAILKLYGTEYQLFIFTHEKGFFNELKRNINDNLSDWKLYEFQSPENQKVRYKDAKSEMQKAKAFLENGDYENCALELRKLGEIIFKNFLTKNKSEIFNTKDYVSFSQMLDEAKNIISQSILQKFQDGILKLGLSADEWNYVKAENFNDIKISPDITKEVKEKIFKARNAVFDSVQSVKAETHDALQFVNQVRKIKDRLLNYGAHPSDDTLYKTEMEDAVGLFEKLQNILKRV